MKGQFLLLIADKETKVWSIYAQVVDFADIEEDYAQIKHDKDNLAILVNTSDFITF